MSDLITLSRCYSSGENEMLRSIHVKNIALIEEEEIILEDGLNILTGETGAGKSILIGSINIALGSGSFKNYVPDSAGYSLIELTFETESEKVKRALKKADLPDMDGIVVISRRFQNGRSVSRLNGESVPISLVREISGLLIDIHGQHEHQSLLYPKAHLALTDDYAGEELAEPKERCRKAYREYAAVKNELDKALTDEKSRLKRIDFLKYEITEIDDAVLEVGEDEELESLFRKLTHAQRIREVLAETSGLIDGEGGALMAISRASGALSGISDLDEGLSQLAAQACELEELAGDFSRAAADYLDDFDYDEETFTQTGNRLDLINRLKLKYGKTIPEILSYRDREQGELEKLTDFDTYVNGLRARAKKSFRELEKAAFDITAIRRKAAASLGELIRQSLEELNFLNVEFEIHMEKPGQIGMNGADEVTFLISTNPGMPLRPLQEVASGGELSRIMLGIKTVMARKDQIESLIFDEIDTGISGRTAQRVSEKMAQLSRFTQVIAITHLAQIAAMADHHYLIEKQVVSGKTRTDIRLLSLPEQTEELTRILGGAQITDAVRANAREMKNLAEDYKRAWKQDHTELV